MLSSALSVAQSPDNLSSFYYFACLIFIFIASNLSFNYTVYEQSTVPLCQRSTIINE